MGVLTSDTFTRANATGGWGTSSSSDVWSVVQGTASFFSISANEGVITGSLAVQTAFLGSKTSGDAEALVRFALSGTSDSAFVHLRATAATTSYRVKQAGGSLTVVRTVSGTGTTLATASNAVTLNSFYWIRFRVSGSNVYAKIWADGSSEPAPWTITTTDGSPITGAGQFGLGAALNNTANTVKFDSYTVNQVYTMQDQGQAAFSIRAKLQDQGQHKFFTRMKESTSARSTFSTREVLRTSARASFATREKLASQARASFATREKLANQAQASFLIRLKLADQARSSFVIRQKLADQARVSFATRVNLRVPARGTFAIRENLAGQARASFVIRQKLLTSAQDTFLIALIPTLRSNPVVTPNPVMPFTYAGSTLVPINFPLFPYQVNGAVLRTQPSLLTAPTTMSGNTLLAGSMFILVFNRPDANTQAVLANGTQCSMTFGLPAGNMVTGTVSVSSVLTGIFFQVVCTLVNPITINTYVIRTPFF